MAAPEAIPAPFFIGRRRDPRPSVEN